MKKIVLFLTAAVILASTSFFGACSKNADDMKCDVCHTDGKKVTVKAMQKAIDKANKRKDDDPIEELCEKMVVKYEENVELCEDCADDKYDDPETLSPELRTQWEEKMQTVLPYAQASMAERYGEVMALLVGRGM